MILTFVSSTIASGGSISATVASTNSTQSFSFTPISHPIGFPIELEFIVNGVIPIVVVFPDDYLGQPFTYVHTDSSVVNGTFSDASAAPTHYAVVSPATLQTGDTMLCTVIVEDVQNNIAMDYSGTVHFTSSDTLAVLPANGTLFNGVGIFSVTLNTAGTQTVTATDTITGSITGNSSTAVSGTPLNFDIVTVNSTAGSVSVLLGNGNGTFQTKKDFSTNFNPAFVAVGELSGDGKPDIIVANAGNYDNPGNSLSLLLGNGNGTFQIQQTVAVQRSLTVAVADMNGDGVLDIINGNWRHASVGVLLSNGNGTFQAPKSFACGSYPRAIAVGDINGDGNVDVAVASYYSSSVNVLLNIGNGTLHNNQSINVGLYPNSITMGDATGDGKPDIIVTNANNNAVTILLGNGDGTFQAKQTLATGVRPTGAILADVNGDSIPDLLFANFTVNTVSVLLGNGNGTFQTQKTFTTGTNPVSVAVADINGDGKSDIVVSNNGVSTVSVLLGNGNGTFKPKTDFATGSGPGKVLLAKMVH